MIKKQLLSLKERTIVSVIIPTYNRKETLLRALRSVLHQTRPPEEIIVVDDGSTDGTGAVVQQEFPSVRYLRQENRGISAARNRGIREASGEWVAFLDSDDEWLPRKLERQLEALEHTLILETELTRPNFLHGSRITHHVASDNLPAELTPPISTSPSHFSKYSLCHTNEIWIRRGRRVNPKKKHAKSGGYIYQKCLPLCVISPSSVIIHRSVFEEVGLFDESLPVCEDYDLWLRICCRYPVLYLEEPLIVKYGGHEDQLSRRYWGMDRFRIQALEKMLASGILGEADYLATLNMVVEKLRIVIQGAEKRGNRPLLDALRPKLTHYQALLNTHPRR